MQPQQFNNLMQGKEAKWSVLPEDYLSMLKGEKKEFVKNNEELISAFERSRMNDFIEQQRALGTKETTIRSMVKRMWNIQIV